MEIKEGDILTVKEGMYAGTIIVVSDVIELGKDVFISSEHLFGGYLFLEKENVRPSTAFEKIIYILENKAVKTLKSIRSWIRR